MYDKKHAYLPHQENSHAPYLAQLRNFSAWVIAVFLISMMVTSCSSFLTERGMGRVSGCNAANVSKLLAPATALGLFSAELKRSQIYEKISVHINHFKSFWCQRNRTWKWVLQLKMQNYSKRKRDEMYSRGVSDTSIFPDTLKTFLLLSRLSLILF